MEVSVRDFAIMMFALFVFSVLCFVYQLMYVSCLESYAVAVSQGLNENVGFTHAPCPPHLEVILLIMVVVGVVIAEIDYRKQRKKRL